MSLSYQCLEEAGENQVFACASGSNVHRAKAGTDVAAVMLFITKT